MKITIQELRACLDLAADFTKKYEEHVGAGTGPSKSQDDAIAVAQKIVGEISIFELDKPLPHQSIIGFYVAEEVGYSIVLSGGLPVDVTKFVVCKELFHVLLDRAHPEYRSTNVEAHLEEVMTAFPVRESEPGPAVRSEFLTEIAAMEFLFPYSARRDEVKSNSADFQALAEKYRVPQYLIERYLSPEFMAELGAMTPGG